MYKFKNTTFYLFKHFHLIFYSKPSVFLTHPLIPHQQNMKNKQLTFFL